MKKIVIALSLALCLAAAAFAQTVFSQISGTVQDPSGAAVAGAKVTITNTDTGATRSVDSAQDGDYVLTNLPAGPYKLQVTREGFSTFNQSGIVIQVNTNPQINVTMKIGSVSETVEVMANAAMLETQSTAVGQVIDQQRVVDLPLNGRNVAQLITLSGAAVQNTAGGLVNSLNYPTVSSFAVAGGQGNSTNYFLDGGSHLDPRTNVGLPLPFPDALLEFKVETSTLPANYGSHPGGAVNVVTRSGTNQIHGDAFEFLRNYAVNARNFFAPTRDSLKRNQFGGVIGGPVKKDRIFFFAGYQHTIERTAPTTTQSFVATQAVLQGDFRTILGSPCQKTPVTLNAASGATGNVLPASRLNPIALKFLNLIPISADPCGKVLNGVPQIDREYQFISRVDWNRSASDTWFARYFMTDYNLKAYYEKGNLLTAGSPGLLDRVQTVSLGDTYLLSGSMVNSFRVSYARSAIQRIGAEGVPTMASLGSAVYSPIPNYTGQVSATGYFSTGAIPGWIYTNVYTVSEELAWNKGNHQFTFGGNWNHTILNGNGPFQQNPRMTFNGSITGNALGDFITGNIATFLQGNGQIGRDAVNMPAIYAQDNWKVGRRLQINAGVRWDPFIPQHHLYGIASQFDPGAFYAGTTSQTFRNAPAGLSYPGDPGFPGKSDTTAQYKNFAPRVGFVLDPRGLGKETIRGGYGLFYDSSYLWNTMQIPLNAPWGNSTTLVNVNLSNPWSAYPGGNPFPTPQPSANVAFPTGGSYRFQPRTVHPTYVQQWNLAFQKQVASNWLVSATYLGNKTTHQWLGRELNPAVFIAGATTGNQESRRTFTRANPNAGKYFTSVIMTDDGGNASYNGLLASVNRRFSHGYSVLANYTWSHCLNQGDANQDIANFYQNPSDRRGEWGNCINDRRQVFNLSAVTESPKFANKSLQMLAGNWQFSPIFTASSGSYLNITAGTDVSLTAVNADRPNVIGNAVSASPSLAAWFNTAAFTRQPAGTYGNAGRNVVVGPGRWNVDASLSRSFNLREAIKLTVRAEAFNLLNHARFNNPGGSLSSGTTFGIISSAQDPRIMQVALKLVY